MTTNRVGATAVLLSNGKVLIAGGFGSGTITLPRLTSAELYDPATGTFTLTESMIVARVMHSATLLNDGKVLITGGTDDNAGGGAAVADAELYDPATGSFAPTGAMHTDRAQHTATLLTNGEVFVAGGWNGHRADAADDPPWDPLFAELYDSVSKSFKTAANMSTTRISPLVLRLTNGKVLVLGGVPSLQNIHEQPEDPQYAEVYDPASNSFAAISNLSESRRGFTATLLSTGQVLLAGGENGGVVATVELLDPTSGSLAVSGSLVTGRKGHTATRLNDGRVLVTGGVDNQGTILASAELFK
jgi:N-acetylneuraminic acid mutarotase